MSFFGTAKEGTVYLEGTRAKYTPGKLIFENGDVYEGELKHYLPNGNGSYYYGSADVYTGEFKNGYPEGEGTYTFVTKDTFKGKFVKGVFTEGTLTITKNGTSQSYSGSFKKSNFFGIFSYLFLDGTYYEGGYQNGLPNGKGKATLQSGDVYEGYFKNGYFEGPGKYTFKDESVLLCEFEKGKPCGKGSYTYVENDITKVIEGSFFDGYYLIEESES